MLSKEFSDVIKKVVGFGKQADLMKVLEGAGIRSMDDVYNMPRIGNKIGGHDVYALQSAIVDALKMPDIPIPVKSKKGDTPEGEQHV